jgi:hypothetical protein
VAGCWIRALKRMKFSISLVRGAHRYYYGLDALAAAHGVDLVRCASHSSSHSVVSVPSHDRTLTARRRV